jgi:hypothetical protein
VYVPTRRPITANLAEMNGREIEASWFNPRSGNTLVAGKFGRATTQFGPPAGSSDEHEDWLLLLQSRPGGIASDDP